MNGKKNFTFFFTFIFLLQFFLLFYFNRSFILNNYDVAYWKERFEHSQWSLPLSHRIIGDDGLFSYVGFRLVNGEDPSKINPETQPVGKYLIGFSILIFKNPVYYSIVMGFLTLLAYFLLSKKILENNLNSFIVSLILFLDPLFFSQFWKPWIDISQLFFLLINILFFFYLGKKNYLSATVCGLSLGLFSQTKLPILLPIIFILETTFFFKSKLGRTYFLFVIGFLIGILIPYFQYFLIGHTLIDFIKFQKFVLNFYKSSLLVTHFGAIWESLFLGNFPNISGTGFTKIAEWWILWPIASCFSLLSILKIFKEKKKNLILKGISIFSLSELTIFALIPSYPRYLIMVLPLTYILSVYFIQNFLHFKYKNLLYVIIVVFAFINSFIFLIPKSDALITNFYYNFSNQYFQDIFQEDLSKKSVDMTRQQFSSVSSNVMKNATVKKIEINEKERTMPLFSNKGNLKIEVIYKTQDLGSFSEYKSIELVKENSLWRIKWNWNILLDEFKPGLTVTTTTVNGKRGMIKDKNGNIYARDDLSYLISVNPEKIDRSKENEMLSEISFLVKIVPVRIQDSYLDNNVPKTYVPIATLFRDISDEQKRSLLKFPGLMLSPYYSRIYNSTSLNELTIGNTFYEECCTRIYSSYNYHGLSGVEKNQDNLLSGHDGGTISILNRDKKIIKLILNKNYKNGQDVEIKL